MIGYMLTWTTYGTWLQGDERGWVKNGIILPPDKELYATNRKRLQKQPVKLSESQKRLVEETIICESQRIEQQIYAITVCSNHIHIVAKVSSQSISQVVHRYKRASTYSLQQKGFNGRVWGKGHDKRYCFTEEDLNKKIGYVLRHNKKSF